MRSAERNHPFAGSRVRFRRRLRGLRTLLSLLLLPGLLHCAGSPPEGRSGPDAATPIAATCLDSLRADLELLMSPAESEALAALGEAPSADDRDSWLADFWRRRDPSPATVHNERREEHEQRLALARERFGQPGLPGFDARGRAYVLFGPPDRVLARDHQIDTFFNPRREAWIWDELGYLAEYWDFNIDGNFEPAIERDNPLHPRNRLEKASTLDAGWINDPEALLRMAFDPSALHFGKPFSREKATSMYAAYAEAVKKRLIHSSGLAEAPPLWAVFATDCFRGIGGRTRVEVSYQLRLADLCYVRQEGQERWEARLCQSLAILDSNRHAILRTSKQIRLDRGTPHPEEKTRLFSGLICEELPPGDYGLALQLEDEQAGRLQAFETALSVRDFSGDSLRLSDITFASAITSRAEPALFRKGAWNVFPHPLHSYGRGLPLQIYFEVYGLETDRRGLSDYRLSYRILSSEQKSGWHWPWNRKPPFVDISASLANRQEGELSAHPLSIEVEGLATGDYMIAITIEDLISGHSVRRLGRFSVIPGTFD